MKHTYIIAVFLGLVLLSFILYYRDKQIDKQTLEQKADLRTEYQKGIAHAIDSMNKLPWHAVYVHDSVSRMSILWAENCYLHGVADEQQLMYTAFRDNAKPKWINQQVTINLNKFLKSLK